MPPRAELAVDARDDHVDRGDAAVGRPRLLAVEHPLVLRLVVAGRRAQGAHIRARVGLGDAERGDLDVVGRAEALRDPLAHLLGRAGSEDARDRQRGAHDRQTDAGVAPEQLLVDDRHGQAGGVGPELAEALHAVEADLRGLLDDRPRRLLALVPLRRGGPHDAGGEAMNPVAHVALVLAELQGEGGGGAVGRRVVSGGGHRLQATEARVQWMQAAPRARAGRPGTGSRRTPWRARRAARA